MNFSEKLIDLIGKVSREEGVACWRTESERKSFYRASLKYINDILLNYESSSSGYQHEKLTRNECQNLASLLQSKLRGNIA